MNSSKIRIGIIGGGAAGFFAAIQCASLNANAEVIIFERTNKLLSKVRISGGGRCNVTHACFDVKQLLEFYPRGKKQLHSVFTRFNPTDTIQWFDSRGVKLKAEADGRMFPVTDSSQTIIDCLMSEAEIYGVKIKTMSEVNSITPTENGFELLVNGQQLKLDKVLIATGGHPSEKGFQWLSNLGIGIVKPVPSLFSFNINDKQLVSLMGLSLKNICVKLAGSNFSAAGPVVITHWGLSGPAILKLSSIAARSLADLNYQFILKVNWLGDEGEDDVRKLLIDCKTSYSTRKIVNHSPVDIPLRLWEYLVRKSEIGESLQWANLSKEMLRKLVASLTNDQYSIQGKTTFKEEFVTCGGVDLAEIDFKTMESKKMPGLHFAGEVLDIDAVTGGFNFQAAWSTGFVAGTAMAVNLNLP